MTEEKQKTKGSDAQGAGRTGRRPLGSVLRFRCRHLPWAPGPARCGAGHSGRINHPYRNIWGHLLRISIYEEAFKGVGLLVWPFARSYGAGLRREGNTGTKFPQIMKKSERINNAVHKLCWLSLKAHTSCVYFVILRCKPFTEKKNKPSKRKKKKNKHRWTKLNLIPSGAEPNLFLLTPRFSPWPWRQQLAAGMI